MWYHKLLLVLCCKLLSVCCCRLLSVWYPKLLLVLCCKLLSVHGAASCAVILVIIGEKEFVKVLSRVVTVRWRLDFFVLSWSQREDGEEKMVKRG